MNQLFKAGEHTDDTVQSFQLEIKKTGYRDSDINIEKTAEALGAALLQVSNGEDDKSLLVVEGSGR